MIQGDPVVGHDGARAGQAQNKRYERSERLFWGHGAPRRVVGLDSTCTRRSGDVDVVMAASRIS